MDFEEDYLEYVTIFSLSLITVSASYFIDISRPVTLLILLLVPLTFGYTTYVSREGFKRSSLTSVIALFFTSINYITALVAIVVGLGTPLISAFSGGERFKDYFRTASIPLLIIGLIIGSVAYYQADSNPNTKTQLQDIAAETAGTQAELFMEQTNLLEDYQSSQTQVVELASQNAVVASQAYVLNETQDNLDQQEQTAVIEAFNSAEEEIPDKMREEAQSVTDNSTVDVSGKISSAVRENLDGRILLALIPAMAILFYSFNPVMGLLMALAAILFKVLDRKIEFDGAT